VRYFHEVFHSVRTHAPQLKETNQALALVAQHGIEDCRHVIDFARAKAEKTDFQIQHFGAVLSYASRALAEKNRKRQNPRALTYPLQQSAQPVATDAQARGEGRLALLTKEQAQARFEKVKAELIGQNPFLARTWKEGGSHEKMVRARLVRELATEPLELVLLPPWLDALCQWHRPAQNLPL
jgi:hypothetical protein